MKVEKICETCREKYLVRSDKKNTSKTCSKICKMSYLGRTSQEKLHERWEKQSEQERIKEAKESFEKFVEKNSGCWKWKGSSSGKKFNYGKITFHGKSYSAHRLSYEIYIGKIPDGMLVMHKCDNPECTNPDHLILGTHVDNKRDQIKKGRASMEKLNEEKVYEIKRKLENNVLHGSISEEYGISRTTIWSIQTGRTWKNI